MTHAVPIRILLAEDHAVVRQGLASILEDETDMTVAAQAQDGQQAEARSSSPGLAHLHSLY